ncbi:cell surface glycoprotein CD200 receptor 1-A-like isoform X2 [Dromaius novaehollandiae]|uniref:cell surface glycoprotein CD200 receptor 1-A-like isoform X2 n=1 Tax=Dromaius novaehollandiae TaxID=8790 RepID=UPI000E1F3907|nr:cell surface glycoprotein CD200 receptor 1-A-like isoform X2 [Dromaius novaehollandiae]
MKAGADMKIAGKIACVSLLLIITKLKGTVGNNKKSAAVGDSFALICSNKSDVIMVTWKISPKTGGHCTLGYRADLNQTNRTNCTENMSWKSRPDRDPTLQIQPVGRASEGNYICEMATREGNFHQTYHLTVLVPPELTVYCDSRGNPVCKAVAGKPAAQIWWVPASSSRPEEEDHGDETVTILSTFTGNGTDVNSATCFVSHPAMSYNQSIACPSKDFTPYISIIPGFLSIVIFIALIYYFKLHGGRLCHKSKPPETAPTHSLPDDITEVEPYTTYVQKENVIYNSVSDLTVEQNLPRGLLPVT